MLFLLINVYNNQIYYVSLFSNKELTSLLRTDNMAHSAHIVVFDGTTNYVVSSFDLAQEIEDNEVEVVKSFNSEEAAFQFADKQNELATDPLR